MTLNHKETEETKQIWAAKSIQYIRNCPRMSCTIRATVEAFKRLGRIKQGSRVIELGCGHGRAAEALASIVADLDYTGVDFTQALLDEFTLGANNSARSVSLVCADIRELAFEDSEFDVAVSTRVFQYVTDPVAVLAETKRVLLKGGRAVIAVPNAWNPIHAMFYPNRLYSPKEIANWFKKCAFRDISAGSCIFSPRAAAWDSWLYRFEFLSKIPGIGLLGGAAIVSGTK